MLETTTEFGFLFYENDTKAAAEEKRDDCLVSGGQVFFLLLWSGILLSDAVMVWGCVSVSVEWVWTVFTCRTKPSIRHISSTIRCKIQEIRRRKRFTKLHNLIALVGIFFTPNFVKASFHYFLLSLCLSDCEDVSCPKPHSGRSRDLLSDIVMNIS